MPALSRSRQMPFSAALLIWAAIALFGIFTGLHLGYQGPRFAIAIGVAAVLLAAEIFTAGPSARDRIVAWLGGHAFFLAPLLPLGAFLVYALELYPASWLHVAAGILYAILPALLAASARGKASGVWQDYAALFIIPIGEAMHFIRFGPTLHSLRATPLVGAEILVFTAWPEEFLFRGLLQNLLSRSFKSRRAGWIAASIIFGFAHILHAPVPNWKYVLLATIAGLLYGRAWMKTGSLVPDTIIHALVDTIWFGFFPR